MSTFTLERQEIGYDRDTEMCEVVDCRVRPVPYRVEGVRTVAGAVNILRWRVGSQRMGAVMRVCDKHLTELANLLTAWRDAEL